MASVERKSLHPDHGKAKSRSQKRAKRRRVDTLASALGAIATKSNADGGRQEDLMKPFWNLLFPLRARYGRLTATSGSGSPECQFPPLDR